MIIFATFQNLSTKIDPMVNQAQNFLPTFTFKKDHFSENLPPLKMRNLQESDPIAHYNPARQRSVAATTST